MKNKKSGQKNDRKSNEVDEGNVEIISVSSYSTNYSPIINNSMKKSQIGQSNCKEISKQLISSTYLKNINQNQVKEKHCNQKVNKHEKANQIINEIHLEKDHKASKGTENKLHPILEKNQMLKHFEKNDNLNTYNQQVNQESNLNNGVKGNKVEIELKDEEKCDFDLEDIKEDKYKMKGLKSKYCIPLSNKFSIFKSFKDDDYSYRKIPCLEINKNKRMLESSRNLSFGKLSQSNYSKEELKNSFMTLKDCVMPEKTPLSQEKQIQNPIKPFDFFKIQIEEDCKNTPVFRCISLDQVQKERITELQKLNDKNIIKTHSNQKPKEISAEEIAKIRKKLGKIV